MVSKTIEKNIKLNNQPGNIDISFEPKEKNKKIRY